jgi:superoxide reductase
MTGQHTSGSLISMYDSAAGEAPGKRESHTPRIDAPVKVKPDEIFNLKVTVGPHS